MRSCDEILDLMSAALDGQLTADEQVALDEHLSCCPACSALFDELRVLHEASAQLEDLAAPAGFAQQVMNCIATDPAQEQADRVIPFPAKKVSRSPWKKWAACAAAVAIVALGAVSLPGQLSGSKAAKADNAEPVQYIAADVSDAQTTYDYAATGSAPQAESTATDSKSTAMSTDYGQVALESAPSELELLPLCGTLYLTDDHLPDGLEEFQTTESSDGTLLYYLVSADYFFALEEQGFFPADESDLLALGESDAKYGLIIVKPAS